MKLVLLRKNGSFDIVGTYLVEEGMDVSEEEVPDGYYLVVRDVTIIPDKVTPAEFGSVLTLDVDRERKASAKILVPSASVGHATAN